MIPSTPNSTSLKWGRRAPGLVRRLNQLQAPGATCRPSLVIPGDSPEVLVSSETPPATLTARKPRLDGPKTTNAAEGFS